MSARELLATLHGLGARVELREGRLVVDAPSGRLTPEMRERVRALKPELEALLAPRGPGWEAEDGPVPLSPGEERIWRLARRAPDDAGRYGLAAAYRVEGPLDASALDRALEAVADRHPVLRWPIREIEGRPARVPPDRADPLLHVDDEVADDGRIALLLDAEAREAFALDEGPFLRARLIPSGDAEHVLSLVVHHISADGWSLEVLVDELGQLYAAERSGRPAVLAESGRSCADVARLRRARIRGPHGNALREGWTRILTPPPPDLHLEGAESGRDVRADRMVPADLAVRLDRMAEARGATPFMVWLALWGHRLARLAGRDDVIVCTPDAGREEPGTEALVGYLNRVLPVRLDLSGSPAFSSLVDRARTSFLESWELRDLPLHEIAALDVVRRVPLTRALLIHHARPMRALELEGLTVTPLDAPRPAPTFDLSLIVSAEGDGLRASLHARSGVLSPAATASMLDALLDDAGRVAEDADHRLGAAAPVPPAAGRETAAEDAPAAASVRRPIWLRTADDGAQADVDALLAQVALVWERVLGVTGSAPDDDFFALGGHSLLAVRLIEELERETGIALPLATLVSRPTPKQIADALRRDGWSLPEAVLVPMGTGGGGPATFLIHSFEGHVFFYNELAEALADDGPVYGLQAVGIDGRARPQRTVEDMARTYLDRMRSVQPAGPYRIAAMCFGIAPGLEICRALAAGGEEASLILIDSAFEHLDPEPSLLAARSGPLVQRLRAAAWRARERLVWWRRMADAPAYARRERALKDAIVRAWYRYHPRPWSGAVTLVRSEASDRDPARAWHVPALRDLTSGSLRVAVVPGDHFSVLRAPAVHEVAREILGAAGQPASGPT